MQTRERNQCVCTLHWDAWRKKVTATHVSIIFAELNCLVIIFPIQKIECAGCEQERVFSLSNGINLCIYSVSSIEPFSSPILSSIVSHFNGGVPTSHPDLFQWSLCTRWLKDECVGQTQGN